MCPSGVRLKPESVPLSDGEAFPAEASVYSAEHTRSSSDTVRCVLVPRWSDDLSVPIPIDKLEPVADT